MESNKTSITKTFNNVTVAGLGTFNITVTVKLVYTSGKDYTFGATISGSHADIVTKISYTCRMLYTSFTDDEIRNSAGDHAYSSRHGNGNLSFFSGTYPNKSIYPAKIGTVTFTYDP